MAKNTLFDEGKIGSITLRNRVVMAPLTRQCADDDGTPNEEMVAYYSVEQEEE